MSADLDAFEDLDDIELGEDIDQVAVDRRCAGDHTVPLNRAEAAQAFERLEQRGLSAQEIGDALGVTQRTVVRWRNGAATPISLRGETTVTTPTASPLGRLLEDAAGHGSARVRRLAERIESQLDDLRALIAQDAEKEKARQVVARLEKELAAAKARLAGKPQPTVKTPAAPKACKDCSTEIVRPSGQRGVLPSRCASCRAKADARAV